MALLILLAVCLLVLAWLLGKPYLDARRRRALLSKQLPEQWRRILELRTPGYAGMPAALQRQLEGRVQVFLAEKKFIGCAGLDVDDDMRVTIAGQACLLILNRADACFPHCERILVYPGAFVVDKTEEDEAGVLSSYSDVLSGESWGEGQVILSWEDILEDLAHPQSGTSVIIHEFAHQLDQEKGDATGAPILSRAELYQSWSETFSAEYEQLRAHAEHDAQYDGTLDPYGAEHPAEFFAVATESFFLCSADLREEHPMLYRELQNYYRLDPAQWTIH